MTDGFTKIYREERELLRKTNTGAAYEVYMYLKDKYNYFKYMYLKDKHDYFNQEIYVHIGYLAERLDMTEITLRRTIKKLKEVGLIESKRAWGYANGQSKIIYICSFPIVDKIEGKITDDAKTQQTIENAPNIPKTSNTSIKEEDKTKDITKTDIWPQFTNLSEWAIAITNKIFDLEEQLNNISKEMAIKNIEKIITDLGTDTKDALDFKEYMTEIITDSIRRKRYEQAI